MHGRAPPPSALADLWADHPGDEPVEPEALRSAIATLDPPVVADPAPGTTVGWLDDLRAAPADLGADDQLAALSASLARPTRSAPLQHPDVLAKGSDAAVATGSALVPPTPLLTPLLTPLPTPLPRPAPHPAARRTSRRDDDDLLPAPRSRLRALLAR